MSFGTEDVGRVSTGAACTVPPSAFPADQGQVFDREFLRAVLQKTLAERDVVGGHLADLVGVGGTALAVLLMLNVPGHPVLAPEDYVLSGASEEHDWVRDLLLRHVSTDLEITSWIAAIVARRAMQADHLWQDLGFPDRSMLNALMARHFATLSASNTENMRWKRFFYRTLCEEEGLSHCTSPSCSDCADVERCFEPESAEARIARAKRGLS